MLIQKAQETDIEPILSLAQEITDWQKAKGVHQWRISNRRDVLEKDVSAGEVFVYREAEIIMGTVTLRSTRDPYWDETPEKALYLHRLGVRRSYSGRELGRKLVRFSEDECKRLGVPVLRLDCAASNPILRAYYQKLEFQFCGIKFDPRYELEFALFEKKLLDV